MRIKAVMTTILLCVLGLMSCANGSVSSDNKVAETSQEQLKIVHIDTSMTFEVNGVSFVMKPIEGGIFRMGSDDEDAFDDEKPVHDVSLSSFYMSETEVTQVLWEAVMGNNPSCFVGSNLPVEQVSWGDCQEFISKLNGLTGKKFRLPTEAEWEYAARGGVKSRGYKFAGSDNVDEVAWHANNSNLESHPVGQKVPNELGLYDMSGSVWEWCMDWYGEYSGNMQTDPHGENNGSVRVLRGGSRGDMPIFGQLSKRGGGDPDFRSRVRGFRLVLPL